MNVCAKDRRPPTLFLFLSLSLSPWLSSSHSRILSLSLSLFRSALSPSPLPLLLLASHLPYSRPSSPPCLSQQNRLVDHSQLLLPHPPFLLLQLLGSCSFSFLKYSRPSPTRPVRQPAFLSSPPYTLHHQRQHTYPHALHQKRHYPLVLILSTIVHLSTLSHTQLPQLFPQGLGPSDQSKQMPLNKP